MFHRVWHFKQVVIINIIALVILISFRFLKKGQPSRTKCVLRGLVPFSWFHGYVSWLAVQAFFVLTDSSPCCACAANSPGGGAGAGGAGLAPRAGLP